jgi:hypothetical protein
VAIEPNAPTIVESFRDFEPPSNFRRDVETLLRYVPPKYLVGLSTIVLTNCAALTRDKRKQKSLESKSKGTSGRGRWLLFKGLEIFSCDNMDVCGQHWEGGIDLVEMGATSAIHDACGGSIP